VSTGPGSSTTQARIASSLTAVVPGAASVCASLWFVGVIELQPRLFELELVDRQTRIERGVPFDLLEEAWIEADLLIEGLIALLELLGTGLGVILPL